MIKTVAMFITVPEASEWILLDGDKRHWDNVFVNGGNSPYEEEVSTGLYDDVGNFLAKKISREEAETEVKNGAYLIQCGFIL